MISRGGREFTATTSEYVPAYLLMQVCEHPIGPMPFLQRRIALVDALMLLTLVDGLYDFTRTVSAVSAPLVIAGLTTAWIALRRAAIIWPRFLPLA